MLRLVIVEDSPTQRTALVRLLEAGGDMTVVATAEDCDSAVAAVAEQRPDVVTMDLDVPGGSGAGAIRRIMAEHPVPVLVLSALIDGTAAALAVEALAAGAVDATPKPQVWDEARAEQLRRRVRRIARVPVVRRRRNSAASPRPAGPVAVRPPAVPDARTGPMVGIAASTGGPNALPDVLAPLCGLAVPVLLVQHIDPSFITGLSAWVRRATGWPARVVSAGDVPEPGVVHLAPGGVHLTVDGDGRFALPSEPSRGLHRPSGDVLLTSIARHAGASGIGVVLTGMGDDGARGLLAIREAGGTTLAQDQATCAVFGMPRVAHEIGATDVLLPPAAIAGAIREAVGDGVR